MPLGPSPAVRGCGQTAVNGLTDYGLLGDAGVAHPSDRPKHGIGLQAGYRMSWLKGHTAPQSYAKARGLANAANAGGGN